MTNKDFLGSFKDITSFPSILVIKENGSYIKRKVINIEILVYDNSKDTG